MNTAKLFANLPNLITLARLLLAPLAIGMILSNASSPLSRSSSWPASPTRSTAPRQAFPSHLRARRLSRSACGQSAADRHLRYAGRRFLAAALAADPGRHARRYDPRRVVVPGYSRNPSPSARCSFPRSTRRRRSAMRPSCSAHGRSAWRRTRSRNGIHFRIARRRLDDGVWRGLYRSMARPYEPLSPGHSTCPAVSPRSPFSCPTMMKPSPFSATPRLRADRGRRSRRWKTLGGRRAPEGGASLVSPAQRTAPARRDRRGRRRARRLFLETDDFERDHARLPRARRSLSESAAPRILWSRRRVRRSLGRQVGSDPARREPVP